MASAYKCDMTGEIKEGAGVKAFAVELGAVRLDIVPHKKVADRKYDQGELSPEAVRRIEAALLPLAPKQEKKV